MDEIVYDVREAFIGLLETVCERSGFDRRRSFKGKRRDDLSLPERRRPMLETAGEMSLHGG